MQMKAKWEKQRKEEEEKNKPLEEVRVTFTINTLSEIFEVCSALRENLEEQYEKRLSAANKKFKPIIITDEPSRKVCR